MVIKSSCVSDSIEREVCGSFLTFIALGPVRDRSI